jgi:arsenate reductase
VSEQQPVEIWFNPSCSKCRMAREMLHAAGTDYVVRRYLDEPPDVDQLDEVLTRLGLEPWDITRMGEPVATELGLADRARERGEWLRLLVANPVLIQRPILVTPDGSAWIGREPAAVEAAIAAGAEGGSGQVD